MLLTLNELLTRPVGLLPHAQPRLRRNELQTKLDLVLRQYQLGLDNATLVRSDPELQRLVDQISQVTPGLFSPTKRLQLQIDLGTPLVVPECAEPITVQATVNVGCRYGIPKLVDWSIRRPKLNLQDQIRCWVTAEHYKHTGMSASQLRLVVVALHTKYPPTPVVFNWNGRLHRQTEQWLVNKVQGKEPPELRGTASQPLERRELLDFEAIPEIAL